MMRWMTRANFRGDRGASAVEYAVIVVTIAAFVFGVAAFFGDALSRTLADLAEVTGDAG